MLFIEEVDTEKSLEYLSECRKLFDKLEEPKNWNDLYESVVVSLRNTLL